LQKTEGVLHVPARVMTQGRQVIFGISLMAPIAIFGTYGVANELSKGLLPAAYLLAFLVMLITAYSYGRMVKVYPTSGSAYGYVQKSVHPLAGFLVGWMLLLDYAFVPMLSVLFLGLALHEMVPVIPVVVWVALFIALSTLINIRGLQMAIKVNRIMVGLQFVLIAIFFGTCIYALVSPSPGHSLLSSAPFWNPDFSMLSVIAGTALVCQSFLGFDAVTTIAEESVEPERTIPRTLIFVTILNGIVFILIAYFGVLAYQGRSFISSDTAAVELVEFLGGPLFETLFMLVTAASVFTLIVSQQAGISRLLFVMGRDRVFPEKLFCYTHPRYGTPVGGIVFIGVLTVAACMIFDLVTLASLINLGAFVAFAFVNLCVILHYFVKRRLRTPKAVLLYLLLPAIGIGSNLWLLTSLSPQAFLVGGIWFAAGLLYLTVRTKVFTQIPDWGLFDTSL
jgi:putrescine importer